MKRNTNIQILDIPFPETTDIERQVLADLIADPDNIGDAMPLIHEDFFTNDYRKEIWGTIADYYNQGKTIDLSVFGSLFGKAFFEEVMPKAGQSGGYFDTIGHLNTLRTGAARRRAYFAAAQFLQNALNVKNGETEILASVEGFAAQVEGPAPVETEVTLATALQGVREEVKAAEKAAKEGKSVRVSTGFELMDMTINNGFKPGQLVILAARPGVGKTSIMLHFAKTAARNGFPVYISTLEMTDSELGEKFIYSTGMVRPSEVSYGRVDWTRFKSAEEELAGLPILINQFSRTLEQIVSRITQSVKRGKCRIAFIDYLGLVQDCNMLGNAKLYQIIAKVTGTLKATAKRLGIPIVLLCQLNRDAARDGRSPELYDLRDSGSIEQDADIVLMLEPNKESRTITAWLRKNRGGRKVDENGNDIGFRLLPNETYSAFTELGPEQEIPKEERPLDLPESVTTPKYYDNEIGF